MNRKNAFATALLAVAVPASGCATTHLSGQYRTNPEPSTSIAKEKQLLAKGSEWPLFWGIFEVGSYDAYKDLDKKMRPDEAINNLEIRNRVSVGGVLLWIISAGIIGHHAIEVRGEPVVVTKPPAEPPATSATTPTKERETIIVPAAPAPAGYEKSREAPPEEKRPEKSPDYNEGFRDGQHDRKASGGERSFKSERSGEYNEGYRDALKDASRD